MSRAVAPDLRRRYGQTYRIVRADAGEVPGGVRIVKDYDRALPVVPAYPAELNQVWRT